MKCPICSSPDQQLMFTAKCGRFDGSRLYNNLKVIICRSCHHVYNKVSKRDIGRLADYYENEYAAINLQPASIGDLPGSDSPASLKRYEDLYSVLSGYINPLHTILDVGCAMGGFLRFLCRQGYVYSQGIDSNRRYVEEAKARNITYGDALNLPNKTFDVIVMDQVLEHLANPKKAISEARRVLRKDGILCIAVPDLDRYNQPKPFPLMWFLMREHLQHFNINSLKALCARKGFTLESFVHKNSPMMSKTMVLPNLIAVFRNTQFHKNSAIVTTFTADFLRARAYRAEIEKHRKDRTPIYCWGIGREFFFLWEQGLKNCNIQGLVDSNKYKQTLTVDGWQVHDPSILCDIPKGSMVWITAYAHRETIERNLIAMGII